MWVNITTFSKKSFHLWGMPSQQKQTFMESRRKEGIFLPWKGESWLRRHAALRGFHPLSKALRSESATSICKWKEISAAKLQSQGLESIAVTWRIEIPPAPRNGALGACFPTRKNCLIWRQSVCNGKGEPEQICGVHDSRPDCACFLYRIVRFNICISLGQQKLIPLHTADSIENGPLPQHQRVLSTTQQRPPGGNSELWPSLSPFIWLIQLSGVMHV